MRLWTAWLDNYPEDFVNNPVIAVSYCFIYGAYISSCTCIPEDPGVDIWDQMKISWVKLVLVNACLVTITCVDFALKLFILSLSSAQVVVP